MSNISIQQNGSWLVFTSKTIDWLVRNTEVSVFNPVTFEGYQRQIDEKHCKDIVRYLKTNSFLPSSIICACDEDYTDNSRLRIVDGQHRVNAFKMLEEIDKFRFEEIKNQSIPVVVMVKVETDAEIQTFITINKTSKKVDTSLAYVLKNKISNGDDNITMSRAEYIAVEVAKILNDMNYDDIWSNKILYEGTVKSSNCYISLNAFVRATRGLVNTFNQIGVISLDWQKDTKLDEIASITDKTAQYIHFIWEKVYQRWPELNNVSFEEKQILQGSIGYSAITRTLVKLIRRDGITDSNLKSFVEKTILSFKVPYYQWTKEGEFSKYSSESGYRLVSDVLIAGL